MPEGMLEPGAESSAARVGDRGSVEGIRLPSGDLVLKIKVADATVQILLRGVGRLPEDGGMVIKHPFGLRIPQSVQRLCLTASHAPYAEAHTAPRLRKYELSG